jgi:hypothetical protein
MVPIDKTKLRVQKSDNAYYSGENFKCHRIGKLKIEIKYACGVSIVKKYSVFQYEFFTARFSMTSVQRVSV